MLTILFKIVAAILNRYYNFAYQNEYIFLFWYVAEFGIAMFVGNLPLCYPLLRLLLHHYTIDSQVPAITTIGAQQIRPPVVQDMALDTIQVPSSEQKFMEIHANAQGILRESQYIMISNSSGDLEHMLHSSYSNYHYEEYARRDVDVAERRSSTSIRSRQSSFGVHVGEDLNGSCG